MRKGVSVIICCYNSSHRLPKTLEYLAKQTTSADLLWEVIVVNNNSTDNTSEVTIAEWNKYQTKTSLILVNEPTPGLSSAREKGISISNYDYIVFCDDDNWLSPNYIESANKVLDENDKIAAVGGINNGSYEIEPPKWMRSFEPAYAIGKQGESDFEILEGARYLVGAGMAFKKKAYQEVKKKKFHFFLTDRIGNKIVSGGDVELCFLFKLIGYKIAYTSELVLEHYMPASRLTKAYLVNMWRHYSYSWLVFEAYKSIICEYPEDKINNSVHWLKQALKRIYKASRHVLIYLKRRKKGNIEYYLPYEANFRYNFYLLFNIKLLLRIIQELQQKSKIV